MYDVLIIGCGASGAVAGILASRRGLSVAIVEAEDRGFKKLLTTGNGRCNITNRNISLDSYNEHGAKLFSKVYADFNNTDALDFFRTIGVESTELDDGKIYPMSLQAASVVNNLLDELERSGVQIINKFPVTKINRSKHFDIFSGDKKLSSRALIVACGSKAGTKENKFNGIWKALDTFKIKKEPLNPSLVQLKSDYGYLKHLNGTKFKTTAKLYKGKTMLKSFYGEVLFTDYGLSGIPIMNLSRFFTETDKKGYRVDLDLCKEVSFTDLVSLIETRKKTIGYKKLDKFFLSLVPKSMIIPLIKDNVLNMNSSGSELTSKEIKKIAGYLKSFSLDITGINPFARAQVMCGGIDVRELNDNLSYKKDKDLYFCGEIVDVDGLCGGFNLQWAWSSGAKVGENILL